ncbi:hypothetical protein HanRHA438_Chr13g0588991 [Helianthus annuus]|uniref:Uncharacterized protein n=1 Tax=Helianthus annuus TaxID=4232 RepID=A0A251STN7_HELAN|nr:hypothetical protein HanXRQr2_Chr13g0578171 [Helianthus annuus]KAJ0476152.1 hypothetical protein HanHA300_Chr13g0473971 [Helianthus annuus]KAJ0496959.1 hypothetical protein HanHA89_Chr13g0505891 [Helianthus annuus]KAJ0857343.1 hypothetical protein HanRHA438_Chr13g0588991 [Helianthus annuus]
MSVTSPKDMSAPHLSYSFLFYLPSLPDHSFSSFAKSNPSSHRIHHHHHHHHHHLLLLQLLATLLRSNLHRTPSSWKTGRPPPLWRCTAAVEEGRRAEINSSSLG